MTDPPPKESADLQDLIGPIWRRKWLLLVIVVLSTAGTYFVSSRQLPSYRSSTQVFVSESQITSIVVGGAGVGNPRTTQDEATLLLSAPVTQAVIRQLHLRDTPGELLGTVTATPATNGDSITVSAERASGAEAAAVANAYVNQFIRFSGSQLAKQAAATVGQLRGQLKAIPVRTSTAQQRQNLESTISQVQAAAAAAPSEASQTQPAVASGVPFAPRPKRDAAFAFAIALGLGLALTLALERFDRRITKLEEVDDAYGVPLLAVIPHTATPVNLQEGAAAVPLALREPFRSLRTNLQLAGLEKPIRLVAVASAIAGEGKSTVVTNLALTYREFGLRVVIVEADLRRPSLGASWGINSLPGLTGVLAGACELDEALVEVEVDAPDVELVGRLRGEAEPPEPRTPAATAAGPAKLALLPSGPTPPNPQAVLGADSMFQVLDELAERFDVVLIDTPPLLAVSDAIPLLSHCDGVILVTRVGVTERPAAARAVAAARLDPVVRLLGVVANDVARQPGSSYSYGYGYGYGYGRG